MKQTQIASICHEANRAYCEALGDMSQPAWLSAPEWQVQSAINGVKFHLANLDAGPEASHKSWLAEKLAAGWIYGPDKDPERKVHPCVVEFTKLPATQQAKDYLFRSIVHAFYDAGVVEPE